MASLQKNLAPANGPTFEIKNKERRAAAYLKQKKAQESLKRDARFRRRREEDKNPRLRAKRRAQNVPLTQEMKRIWDEIEDGDGDEIGFSINLERSKRPKISDKNGEGLVESDNAVLDKMQSGKSEAFCFGNLPGSNTDGNEDEDKSSDGDLTSILEDDEDEENSIGNDEQNEVNEIPAGQASSPAPSSASTNLSLIPEAIAAKYPSLFKPPDEPKILITTNLNGTVHHEASLLTGLFPNSHYVPRTRHRYNSHHFSLREIAKYASRREYTALLVLEEDLKRPSGLTVINLPDGPTFHFSMTSWVEGKKLPGHGRPTNHYPELILNNFRTPLGVLTASLFRTMFPKQAELIGRQVVTLHNQRDYIFFRRHRYIFRDKKPTEKGVTSTDGNLVRGVEDIKAGLQELGPRFTLKLRRIDKGVQRSSGQKWQWKGGMEKQRTRFAL